MTTDAELRREEVPAAFDTGAAAYDRLVGANPGYHAHLRLSARRMRLPGEGRGLRLLDAGCGTGASTAALLIAAPHAEIVAIDASAQMLAQARAKAWPSSVRFVHARAEKLAEAGVLGPFDGILAAYLIRNLADPDGQLRALRDLLRPGGTLAVHEYSVHDSLRARAMWNAVCWSVIIPSGRLATGDASLYRYLWRSVEGFDGVRRFRRRLREAGFTGVHSETMTGWQRDLVHTFLASVPLDVPGQCAPGRRLRAAGCRQPTASYHRWYAWYAAAGCRQRTASYHRWYAWYAAAGCRQRTASYHRWYAADAASAPPVTTETG